MLVGCDRHNSRNRLGATCVTTRHQPNLIAILVTWHTAVTWHTQASFSCVHVHHAHTSGVQVLLGTYGMGSEGLDIGDLDTLV